MSAPPNVLLLIGPADEECGIGRLYHEDRIGRLSGIGQEHTVPLAYWRGARAGVGPHRPESRWPPSPTARFEPLCKIYHPKKVTHAAIEIVDTPGLSRTHEGNATRMAMIREAGCLVFVIGAFEGTDPMADLRSFDEDSTLGRHGDSHQSHREGRGFAQEAAAAPGAPTVRARTRHAEDRVGRVGGGPSVARVAHDRGAAKGHPRVPPVEREASAGDRQHGRRRVEPGAILRPLPPRKCPRWPFRPDWNWSWRR